MYPEASRNAYKNYGTLRNILNKKSLRPIYKQHENLVDGHKERFKNMKRNTKSWEEGILLKKVNSQKEKKSQFS